MKSFLAQKRKQALNRETARSCLASNLGLPGIGSMLAGRLVGIPQLLIAGTGMVLTTVCGLRFITWYLRNWDRLQDPYADPIATLNEMWLAVRWALLGIALFVLAWLWGLGVGLSILNAAKRAERANAPPRLPEIR